MRLLGEAGVWVGLGSAALANVTGHAGWLFLAAFGTSVTTTAVIADVILHG